MKMQEFDEHIKRKLSGYKVGDYDNENGWNKFLSRKNAQNGSAFKMVSWIAAACVVIFVGVWGLNRSVDEKINVQVAKAAVTSKEAVPLTSAKAPALKSLAPIAQGVPMALREQKHRKQEKQNNKRSDPGILDSVGKESLRLNIVAVDRNPEMLAEKTIIKIQDPVVSESSSKKVQLPEVITGEQLASMILSSGDSKANRKKLMTFLINKGEQTEYAGAKYSSGPVSLQQINLK